MLVEHTTNQRQPGFSLIEMVIAIAILAFVTLTLYSLFSFTLQVIWENKARVGASALANQKMEIAHNLPYDDVGIISGMPGGSILASESVSMNGIDYTVQTQVVYIDDPHDGLQGEPREMLAADYKRVRIAVSWPTRLTHVPVIFLTDIVPQGVESEVGGGTLFIKVFDAYGSSVSQADIKIKNYQLSPIVDMPTTTSDILGTLTLPGAEPSAEGYEIIVTKTGYSTDKTYATTAGNPSPDPPYQTIFEGQVTSISFFIDLTSSINIHVQDEYDDFLPDKPVTIQGLKTIGLDGEGKSIYKYSQIYNSDASGDVSLTNMEWDSYSFIVASTTGWNVAESDPFQSVNILPNTNNNIVLTLEPRDSDCLRVVVKDVEDQPLKDVSVHLFNATFDQYLKTATSGQVFFTPWNMATSTLVATSSEFVDYSDELLVSGYMVEHVIMTAP